MKVNKLTIILIIIIVILASYICYDKLFSKKDNLEESKNEGVIVTDYINLDYANIFLTNEGYAYIMPINTEEISKLDVSTKIKENLNTLFKRAFIYDFYVNGEKFKGFRIKLDESITKIKKLEIDNFIYIILIKEDNTVGLFDYSKYYNDLEINAIDNYNNYEHVSNIEDNLIVYTNGVKEKFELKK